MLEPTNTEPHEKLLPIYEKGKYINPIPPDTTTAPPSSLLSRLFEENPNITRPPKNTLPNGKVDLSKALPDDPDGLYVTHLGHSSLLIQISGIKILLDPVFTTNVSPVFFFPVRKFQSDIPLQADDLPEIDAVFISHGHFDHLDKNSIKAISEKTSHFIVPQGIAKYLKKWGVAGEKIKEMTWWDECSIPIITSAVRQSTPEPLSAPPEPRTPNPEYLSFACTPARHFFARTPFNMNKSLWVSWVITTSDHRIFFSGDTGYGPHFRQIGYHYGPFDLVLMENGQYNPQWSYAHIFPQQGITAHQELRGNHFLPIHWGSITMAPHNWWDPPEQALKYAEPHSINVLTPAIGETIKIEAGVSTEHWWRPFIPSQ